MIITIFCIVLIAGIALFAIWSNGEVLKIADDAISLAEHYKAELRIWKPDRDERGRFR